MEKKHTICHLCSACCPVVVYLKNNKIILVERKIKTRIKEEYFCPKIKAAAQIVYSPNRLKTPMIKEKKDGKIFWQEVSWKTALNRIAPLILLEMVLFVMQHEMQTILSLMGQ